MNIYQPKDLCEMLMNNTYPGRGIIIGKNDDNKAVCAYFIMGRSVNSRNRVFVVEGENVTIYPFDDSLVEDPSLIIYSPIRKIDNKLIVTNGDQTDTIYDFIDQGKSFEEALNTRKFEPDEPNFTPRISGMLEFKYDDFSYKMNILKSGDAKGTFCNRFNYAYKSFAGVGHFIHTYMCDGNPIPTFCGEPHRVELKGDIDTFTAKLWSSLNEDNKISLAVKYIDLSTGEAETRIINKNQ